MKRPEKKEYNIGDDPRHEGYNQACSDWEKWLPKFEEIENIMLVNVMSSSNHRTVTIDVTDSAKALHKRLRGE